MTMQTLIKWPGGKTKEFIYIKDLIPSFERYIEPFFGGGGIFFQLEPKNTIINDICEELTDFYSLLKEENEREDFKKELYEYANNWEKIPKYIKIFENELIDLYRDFKENKITKKELEKNINTILLNKEDKFNSLFLKKFCLDEKNLLKQIIKNLISKIQRTKKSNKKEELCQQETCIKILKQLLEVDFTCTFVML